MPLPKRKTSHARTTQRRAANWKLTLPSITPCPRCHAPRLNHHVCASCGFYGNRRVLEVGTRQPAADAGAGESTQE